MKTISSNFIAILFLASPLAGMAINPQPLPPGEHQLNLPGATTIDAPPAGFDPVNASDQDLQYFGFPPRPNQDTDPKGYANWARAMKASKTRIVPQLEQTAILHGSTDGLQNAAAPTAKNAVPPPPPHDNNLVTSSMSGYYVQSGATSYGPSSVYFVETDFVVPIAQQQFGHCSGGWQYASAWEGIDGFGSPDVLQAGIEFDAYCSGITHSSYYSAWYEWYPNGSFRISGFPIAPGDDIFVEVWHTSATQGYVYLVNNNTNQAVQIGFTASPGYPLRGNSAEWIVEDANALVNFGFIPFWDAVAYTESGVQYCSTSGTQVVNIGPPALSPFPMGTCSFVVH